jgi:16S rRNA (guanine527-N7)-methyltransferase
MEADSSDPFKGLARLALAVPLSLSTTALERCEVYVTTLLLWRQRLALTAAATPQSIVFDHILDSLYVAPFVKPLARVADIGSGAGFPGIPLAIVCPQARFVLIESRRKKANFLREVARKAQLANVEVVEQRAEALGTESQNAFDVVVSRAVGPVRELLVLAAPLLKRDGVAIAMKGPKGRAENVNDPGFAAAEIVEYRLPSGAQHFLLVFRKL